MDVMLVLRMLSSSSSFSRRCSSTNSMKVGRALFFANVLLNNDAASPPSFALKGWKISSIIAKLSNWLVVTGGKHVLLLSR